MDNRIEFAEKIRGFVENKDFNSIKEAIKEHDNFFIFSKIPKDIWDDECGIVYPHKNIVLPTKSTSGSAGCDFVSNEKIILAPGDSYVFKTGICAVMSNNLALLVFPRSGLGFKYKARLANTVGVIDSDYLYSDNCGHIMIKLTNEGTDTLIIDQGSRFAQGVCIEYISPYDDNVTAVRNGGIGSTGLKGESVDESN